MFAVRKLAKELAGYFTCAKRNDGESYIRIKEDCPCKERLQDLIREAHDGMLPDDWKYEKVAEILSCVGDMDEEDFYEGLPKPDLLTAKLHAWMSSHSTRQWYVDQVLKEGWKDLSMSQLIQIAQKTEIEEIYFAILTELRKWVDEEN